MATQDENSKPTTTTNPHAGVPFPLTSEGCVLTALKQIVTDYEAGRASAKASVEYAHIIMSGYLADATV